MFKNGKKNAALILFVLGVICVAVGFMGCGSGPQGAVGPQGPTGPSASPTSTVDSTVADIASEYPTVINPGINCTVQQVTGGQYLSSASPGYTVAAGVLTLAGSAKPYTLSAGFNQADAASGDNSVVSSQYQYLLTNWINYKVSCNGYLIITEANTYDFDVNSDDGSIVTVSGLGANYSLNDDGTHSLTEKSTTNGTFLYPGVYSFSLQYAQSGGGNFGLILSWIISGQKSVIPGENFYH